MANWYGIDGIEFHFINQWADPEITYNGVRDTSGVTVESTMWERFHEDIREGILDAVEGDDDAFADYMLANADEVKELILMARGELEY